MCRSELADFNITTPVYADTEKLAESIRSITGVRKVLVGNFSLDFTNWKLIYVYDRSVKLVPYSYADFSVTESILVSEGNLPVHENEVAVTRKFASEHNLNVGDNITLEQNRIKKNYIITGFVPGITNSGHNIYITFDGIRRFDPAFRPNAVDVYLEDWADRGEIEAVILNSFGKTISDTRKADASGDSTEERIRSAAEQKMAELLANYNADHVEYAVQIDGTAL